MLDWVLNTPVFCKTGALKNFAKLTRKHLLRSLFFDTVTYVSVVMKAN